MGATRSRRALLGAVRDCVAAPARVIALTIATTLAAGPVTAQEAPSVTTTARSLDFDIPSQDLNAALLTFIDRADLQVFYDVDLVKGLRSAPVIGNFTPEQGLSRLLTDTGLTYRFTSPDTVSLEGPPKPVPGADGAELLSPVTIDGRAINPSAMIGNLPPAYAGGQVATGGSLGILGNRDIMDAPFNVVNYTAETIANQQARSVADVTKNDPSVRTTWADGSYSNQFFIRGFPLANGDISVDGLYGLVPYQMSGTAWVERVEILKGPSALLSGMPPQGSIGGTINLVPKRAGEESITRLTTSYVSDSQFGGEVDFSRRLGDDNEFGVRFTGAYSNGDAPVDGQTNELGEAALALDYIGDRVRLSANVVYQKNYSDNPARPIYARAGFQIPDAPSASSDLGQDWYYADGEDVFGVVRGEVDVTDNIMVYAAFGGRHNNFIGLYNFSYLTNAAGDFSANTYYQPTYVDSLSGEGGIVFDFDTGPVRHELTLSMTGLYNELGAVAPVVSTYTGNIYNPGPAPMPDLSGYSSTAPKTSEAVLTSFAIADSLFFLDDRIQLILGARQQNVQQKSWNATTGLQTGDYDESAVTPAVGLVVKPWENVSFYGNYIEGLSQGPTAPTGSVNVGQTLAPIKSKQYEIGVKVDFGSVTTTLSAFQIEQPSGLLNSTTGVYGLDGEVRNRGVELNVFGEAWDDLRLLGGLTLMDGVQTKTLNGTNNGKKAVGIPDAQLNLGSEWDTPILDGFTLTGRVIYTSSQYASVDNTQSIPSWTRVDVGARYLFDRGDGEPITLRATVENVFNKSYWAAASSTFGLARGAPRTFLLSATFDF